MLTITFDAQSNGQDFSVTSLTFSHTCTGLYRLLVVGVIAGASDIVTGVTYGGVAMTRIAVRNNGNSTSYLYYLLNPPSGANNVVVTTSASASIFAQAASFTNVSQTGQPVASVTNATSASTACANTLTTTEDNCIHIATFAVDAFGVTSITNGTSLAGAYMAYSNPLLITPAGSHTMTGNSGGNNNWASTGAAFSPASPAVGGGAALAQMIDN
jgi:hypothetical protein